MKTINLGFAKVTVEFQRTFVSDLIDSTFRPGDGSAPAFAILSTLTVVGGGLLAWFM